MKIKFSERLAELIAERALTVKKLSDLTDISVQSIYAWMRDDSYNIYLSNLIKICNALNCSLDFIVGRTDTILDFIPKECPSFYENLRKIMKEKGITRYRIVLDTRFYDNYFTVWKSGREPQLNILIELADYIGCTLDYLVGRE